MTIKNMNEPMIQKLWSTGDSLVVTIPKTIIKEYNLKEGQRIGINIIFKEQKKEEAKQK